MASKEKIMLDFEEIQRRYVVTPDTFFSEKSIDDALQKFLMFDEFELDDNLYNEALVKSNLLIQTLQKHAKTEDNKIELERLRMALLGNNMIPRLCGYKATYDFEKIKQLVLSGFKRNISIDYISERIEHDACASFVVLFGPEYINLINSCRLTFLPIPDFLNRKRSAIDHRADIIQLPDKYLDFFEQADVSTLHKFMYETNFAEAFHIDNAFISFKHLYNNIEQYCNPSEFNNENVHVAILFNVFKIIDREFNIGYFESKSMLPFNMHELNCDKARDKTKITKDKGESEWLK